MSMYQRFCRETLDAQGNLQKLVLDYPDDFNFGYDVVDAIAQETPEKRAMVWCNAENEELLSETEDRYAQQVHPADRQRRLCQRYHDLLPVRRRDGGRFGPDGSDTAEGGKPGAAVPE